MASHPRHHCNFHHDHHHHATAAAATCSCLCYSCCATTPSHQSAPPPPQPPPLSTDPLLQALVSQILLQQSPHAHHPHYSALPNPTTSHHHHHQPQHHKKEQFQHHPHNQQQQEQQDHQNHTIISSLLSRIDALESSLRRLSSSSSSSSPYRHHYSIIRDVAARTVQTHFRAFLVRRSRTLRNLKDLALIKSAFITLKSSLSDQTHLDPEFLSRKAMDLLIELDSIQGDDPMIRDGKRAISRDLVRFLNLVDGVSVQRHEFSTKVRFVQNGNKSRVLGSNCRGYGGRDQREVMEKLSDQIQKVRGYARVFENDEEEVELEGFHQGSDDEQFAGVSNYRKNGGFPIRNGILLKRHGVQSGMKKCVSFAENGNVARIIASRNGAAGCNGVPRSDDQRVAEEIGAFSKEAEDDEETHIESGGSDQTSDSEDNPRRNSGAEGNNEASGHYQGKHGNLFFSAPEPVMMESRAELAEERLRKLEERMRGKK